MNEFTITHHLK